MVVALLKDGVVSIKMLRFGDRPCSPLCCPDFGSKKTDEQRQKCQSRRMHWFGIDRLWSEKTEGKEGNKRRVVSSRSRVSGFLR